MGVGPVIADQGKTPQKPIIINRFIPNVEAASK
jgi:hypothetical protein